MRRWCRPESVPAALGAAALLLALIGAAPGSAADPTWFEPTLVPTARVPWDVVAVDLTGDANVDLAVTSANENLVVVLQGDGDGGFTEIGRYAVGETPGNIDYADLDLDGDIDLLTTHYDAGVHVLLGDGTGGFTAGEPIAVGRLPWDVATGDVDGDDIVDLVVTETNASHVYLLTGSGDGTFQKPLPIAVTGTDTGLTGLGRLDGDDTLDAAVTTPDGLWLLAGRGPLGLEPSAFKAIALAPNDLEVVDLDGDGRLDVVIADQAKGIVVWRIWGGTEDVYSIVLEIPVGYGYGSATADFDGDGVLDIAFSDATSDTVSILMGGDPAAFPETGPGPGGAFRGIATVATDVAGPDGVTAADVDGDGRLDLLVALAGADSVLVLRNTGDVPGLAPAPSPVPAPSAEPIASPSPAVSTPSPEPTTAPSTSPAPTSAGGGSAVPTPPATDLGIAPASDGDGALGPLAALAGLSCLAFLLASRSGRIRRR